MPKNKFEEVIFTIIMATVMVYGMVVYNLDSRKRDEDTTSRIAANP